MKPSSVFLSTIFTLLIFNFIYYAIYPISTLGSLIGIIIGFVPVIVLVGVVAGINVLGSGLNTFGTKALFTIGALLNILFSIPISIEIIKGVSIEVQLGLGLLTNVLTVFQEGDFYGFGVIIVVVMGLLCFISALMMITGSNE